MSKISIVGMGRTGTTLVRSVIEHAEGGSRCGYYHFKTERKERKGSDEKWIICRRDFRDVLASNFRSTIRTNPYGDLKDFIDCKDNPCPENYKLFRVEYQAKMSRESKAEYENERFGPRYFISEDQIISQGKKSLEEGWYKWLPEVDYIFHYEAYMEDKEKVITELLSKVGIGGVNAKECIEASDNWLKKNPFHASNKGIINGWKDVFSSVQEQLIIDEFGDWMREYNYIK